MQQASKTGRIKKIIVLAVILILPGFLYYLLNEKGKNRYKPLPVYGEKVLTGTSHSRMGKQIPDTLFHTVKPFTLINQDGHTVQALQNDTTLTVVNFFYTRCHTFCDDMNNEMNRVAEQFAGNKMLRFYTLTVDGDYDTPEVLKQYAASYKPREKRWNFLTGNTDTLFHIAREGFLVDALRDTTQDAHFVNSSSLILLDSGHRIRGYYDVNTKGEVNRLMDEIKLLLTEEIRTISPY